jgi:hypothetical protein
MVGVNDLLILPIISCITGPTTVGGIGKLFQADSSVYLRLPVPDILDLDGILTMHIHGRGRRMAIGLCVDRRWCRQSCRGAVVLWHRSSWQGRLRLLMQDCRDIVRHSPNRERTGHIVFGLVFDR